MGKEDERELYKLPEEELICNFTDIKSWEKGHLVNYLNGCSLYEGFDNLSEAIEGL